MPDHESTREGAPSPPSPEDESQQTDCKVPTLGEQMYLHVLFYLLVDSDQDYCTLVEWIAQIMGIPQLPHDDTGVCQLLRRIQTRCGLGAVGKMTFGFPVDGGYMELGRRAYEAMGGRSQKVRDQRQMIEEVLDRLVPRQNAGDFAKLVELLGRSPLKPLPMLLLAATVTMGWLWRFLRSVWEWADAIEEFQRTVNPAKFNNRKGYLNTDDNIRKFEGFSVHGFAYKTVRAPSETWRMRCGWLYLRYLRFWRPNRTIVLQQTLRLWVCIPEGVTESSQHDDVPVGVIINIHGGGMITGHPMDPVWTSTASLEAVKLYGMIYVGYERSMMPEADGRAVLDESRELGERILREGFIEQCVKSVYPRLKVDREKVILTAESAGAMLAIPWVLDHADRIAGCCLRSPLVRRYQRDEASIGVYMSEEVGLNVASATTRRLFGLLKQLKGEIPPGKSRKTPDTQFAAYFLSATDTWIWRWDATLSIELLECQPSILRSRPIIRIAHGTQDAFVPVQSSEDLLARLQHSYFDVELRLLDEQDHCSDYDTPLYHPDMAYFNSLVAKVVGAAESQ